MSSKITSSESFRAALAALQANGESALSKAGVSKVGGATQLHHTNSDSRPASFAGSAEIAEEEEDDGITEAGTNYLGKSLQHVQDAIGNKLRKAASGQGPAPTGAELAILSGANPGAAIQAKLDRGARLTKAEQWAGATLMKGENPFAKKTEDDGDEDKDDAKKKAEMAKAARAFSDDSRRAIDVSPILADLVKSAQDGNMAIMRENAQLRAEVSEMRKAMDASDDRARRFQKSMADFLVEMGNQQATSNELLAGMAQAPVGGPRGPLHVLDGGRAVNPQTGALATRMPSAAAPLSKGGPSGSGGTMVEELYQGPLRKAAIHELGELIKAGKVHPDNMSKLECGAPLDQNIEAALIESISARGYAAGTR